MAVRPLVFLLLVLLPCCTAHHVTESGFLGNEKSYQQLRPAKGDDFLLYQREPGILRRYSSFVVEPVVVLASSDDGLMAPSERELRNLGEDFRREIVQRLGNKVSVIGHSTPGVARIRVALTDAAPNRALLNLGSVWATDGAGAGGASMEAEIVDSVSGRRLMAVMGSRKDGKSGYFNSLRRWQGTRESFSVWADDLARAVELSQLSR